MGRIGGRLFRMDFGRVSLFRMGADLDVDFVAALELEDFVPRTGILGPRETGLIGLGFVSSSSRLAESLPF